MPHTESPGKACGSPSPGLIVSPSTKWGEPRYFGVLYGFAVLWSPIQCRSMCPGITIIGFGVGAIWVLVLDLSVTGSVNQVPQDGGWWLAGPPARGASASLAVVNPVSGALGVGPGHLHGGHIANSLPTSAEVALALVCT